MRESKICTRHRWCTRPPRHAGDCITTPPARDCTCSTPKPERCWPIFGFVWQCARCGRRVAAR